MLRLVPWRVPVLVVAAFILLPVEGKAQNQDYERFKAGGGYTYLNFNRNSVEIQPYGLHTQYALDNQWAVRASAGVDRSDLKLFRAGTVSRPEGQSTLIPIQLGVAYHFRPPGPGDSIIDYRTYVTAGISLLNTVYSGDDTATPVPSANPGSTRYGLLAGPYAAAGFAATTVSDIPVSLDVSFIRLYYHRSFSSALEPLDGLTYGAYVMISISFMSRR